MTVMNEAGLTGLTVRQQRFVHEYLADLQAGNAAVRAGYSARSAHVAASRLLDLPKIKRAIELALTQRFGLTIFTIIEELAAIAFHDVGELCTWSSTELKIRSSNSLSPTQRKAIVSLKRVRGQKVELILADKLRALELLARVLGMPKLQKPIENRGTVKVVFEP